MNLVKTNLQENSQSIHTVFLAIIWNGKWSWSSAFEGKMSYGFL